MERGAFISYSHKDAAAVQALAAIISEELGFPVWYDTRLHGGDEYFSIIAEQILIYEYFIFVVSHNSVSSDFCTMELEFAKSEKRKILAVWLEDFIPPPRIRLVISHTHYVRTFALSPEGLRKELCLALLEDALSTDNMEATTNSDRTPERYKYFLRTEETKKIQYLLQLEQQGKYSACYEPEAAVLLGIAYELGIHTEKDDRTAEYYYRIAAHKGSADGEYLHLALQLEQGKADIPITAERMHQLAEQGSILAMVYWGEDLYYGRYHQRPDRETAYRWWRRAAQLHHPEAQYYLAHCYQMGDVVEPDPLLAMMYAKESEEGGVPRAHRLQGSLHRHGQFVKKDLDAAIACYQKAVDMGDYLSVALIGDVEWSRGNHALAVEHYQCAIEYAEGGKSKGGAPYYGMGQAYRNGVGVEKDLRKACEMFLQGAQRGHTKCKNLAALTIYQELPDTTEQLSLLEEASSYDCRQAEFYIAKLLEKREHGPCAEALKWYDLGVSKGDVEAMQCAMEYYGVTTKFPGFRNREKALSVMRLFFSLWDANRTEIKKKFKRNSRIAHYYSLYALELATEPERGKPDRNLSLFYIKKTLEEESGMLYFDHFIALLKQYLLPNTDADVVKNDFFAGEALLELLIGYVDLFLATQAPAEKMKRFLTEMVACAQVLEKEYENPARHFTQRLNPQDLQAKVSLLKDRIRAL